LEDFLSINNAIRISHLSSFNFAGFWGYATLWDSAAVRRRLAVVVCRQPPATSHCPSNMQTCPHYVELEKFFFDAGQISAEIDKKSRAISRPAGSCIAKNRISMNFTVSAA
jgi:hypothetical protein